MTVRVDVRNGVTPSHDELVEAAGRYLSSLGATLYGQHFNIVDERDVAAEWLAGQVMAVLREAWWPQWTKSL